MTEKLVDVFTVYVCANKHRTVTRIVDEGKAPERVLCQNHKDCGKVAFKEPMTAADVEPTHEWYRGSRQLARQHDRIHAGVFTWWKNGGLLLRAIPFHH